jgi:hypothetical protein
MYLILIFSVFTAVCLAVGIYEFRNAIMVDDEEPFLFGDYDKKKDPTINS